MIHLRIRTEYSFRRVYGRLDKVMATLKGQLVATIVDDNTWGHVAWAKACKANALRPIFGAEVLTVLNPTERARQPGPRLALLARNKAGIHALYRTMSLAHNASNFYYVPRLGYGDINELLDSGNVVVIAGPRTQMGLLEVTNPNLFVEVSPADSNWNKFALQFANANPVVMCDNFYPQIEDRQAYEILTDRGGDTTSRVSAMHIASEDELRFYFNEQGLEVPEDAYLNTERIAALCETGGELPKARPVIIHEHRTLRQICEEGMIRLGLDYSGGEWGKITLNDPVYQARLERELALIAEKDFADYFFLVGDMVRTAKETMFVGPARGSSAGSLVCWLIGITDVDPIRHDLMFERFIDVTRSDLPDIDIDFPDDKRDGVFEDLRVKYGKERVGRIGTVLRYKAKSCITDVASAVGVPYEETEALKDAIIERSSGDARAQFNIQDALESVDVGKQLVEKYPALRIAGQLEGHATTSGTHAAGICVCEEPIADYCTIGRDNTAQIDKKDAEALNLLKIDVLGLRTLSVIDDCISHIGKTRDWMINYPLDDVEAFEVLNRERFAGIFQFEGYALQSITRQMKVRSFDDIVATTALARPGPLHCGATTEFIQRRNGTEPVTHLHPLAEPITRDTYGTVVYQEQIMTMGRAIGTLSWEDINQIRRAMSKSLGEEFFNQYWEKFCAGAVAQGIPAPDARRIWEKMCTFGSWAFNKSHAVSYGLISYWCAVLKAHYPLQFAAACLRNAKDADQSIKLLRELVKEGFTYKPVDPDNSRIYWEVHEDVLIGGLTNVKGIGEKKARDIVDRRARGVKLLPGQLKLLINPVTPFDDIFEGDRRFGDIYDNPRKHGILSGPVSMLRDIQDAGEYVFIGKIIERNQRDMNEYQSVVKRGGRIIKRNNLFLHLQLEDDSGSIIATIPRFDYPVWGKPIVENGKTGDWYIFKGKIRSDWRLFYIEKHRKLTEDFPREKMKNDRTTTMDSSVQSSAED